MLLHQTVATLELLESLFSGELQEVLPRSIPGGDFFWICSGLDQETAQSPSRDEAAKGDLSNVQVCHQNPMGFHYT